MRWRGEVSWSGSHLAAGVIVGGGATSEHEARARVIATWAPRTSVHVLADGRFYVRFAEPRRLRASEAPGALVCLVEGVPCSAPIDGATLRALDPPVGALVLGRGGRLETVALVRAPRVDPSAWLDAEALTMLDARPLGPPPSAADVPAVSSDARAAIGERIPAAAPEAARDLARLADGEGDGALPPGSGGGWLATLVRWARGLFARDAAAPAAPSHALAPPRAGWLDRLRGWLAERALRSQLGRFLARRQAEYVARMLELFDRGDVREALRWAIPLGGNAAPGTTTTLALPAPRTSLAIGGARGAARSMIGIPGLYELLRRRYLDLVAKLQRDGAVDEAAFVLAELLRDPAGAVALLEREKRYVQAARLADASGLDATTRIRAWLLAGDLDRATRIARQHGGAVAAIAMLRRSNRAAGDRLAVAWAQHLAARGEHALAVDQVIEVAGAERLAAAWIEHALEAGGTQGARMLALRAALSPERWEDTRVRALALLADASVEQVAARQAFAATLATRTGPAVAALARAAVRTIVRDGLPAADRNLADRLIDLAGSGPLRADRPKLGVRTREMARLSARSDSLVVHVAEDDVGTLPVHDAALLPSGRMVLALGEVGVRVVTRDGRRVHAMDVPAERLVVGDGGTRALAIAPTGTLQRIARLDLVDGRSERWWEAQLTAWSRTFDGSAWLVAERGVPVQVDVLDTTWSALVRLEHVTHCVHVEREARTERVGLLAVHDDGLDWMQYDPALRRLVARALVEPGEGRGVTRLVLGTTAWLCVRSEGEHRLARVVTRFVEPVHELPGPPVPGSALAAGGGFVAVASQLPTGVRIDVLVARPPVRVVAHVLLDGASAASLRIDGDVLVIADDRGRVLALDLGSGQRLRDLRIRA